MQNHALFVGSTLRHQTNTDGHRVNNPHLVVETVDMTQPAKLARKPRVAKHAFSRLTDGQRHPVTVRQA